MKNLSPISTGLSYVVAALISLGYILAGQIEKFFMIIVIVFFIQSIYWLGTEAMRVFNKYISTKG